MTVYIDDFNAPYRGMTMCHMIADTDEELHAMADKIGLDRKHFQTKKPWQHHYDICITKKKKALAAGAMRINTRELGRIVQKRRKDYEILNAKEPA